LRGKRGGERDHLNEGGRRHEKIEEKKTKREKGHWGKKRATN